MRRKRLRVGNAVIEWEGRRRAPALRESSSGSCRVNAGFIQAPCCCRRRRHGCCRCALQPAPLLAVGGQLEPVAVLRLHSPLKNPQLKVDWRVLYVKASRDIAQKRRGGGGGTSALPGPSVSAHIHVRWPSSCSRFCSFRARFFERLHNSTCCNTVAVTENIKAFNDFI